MRFFLKTSIRVNQIFSNISKWLNSDMEKIKDKIDIPFFITAITTSLIVSAFIYLKNFYDSFNIDYFNYFTFEDALSILYKKSAILFFIIIFISIPCSIVLTQPTKGLDKNKKAYIPVITFAAMVFVFAVFSTAFKAMPPIFSWIIVTPTGVITLLILTKNVNHAYWFVLVIGLVMYLFSEGDIRLIQKAKITFNLTLSEHHLAMRENDKHVSFVGSTAKWFFLYNDSLKSIRAIPTSEIKEISFKR